MGEHELPADRIRPAAAAAILGRSVQSVYRAVRGGELRAWRVRGLRGLWLSEADVYAELARRQGGGANEGPGG